MGWVKLSEQDARNRSEPVQEDMRVQTSLWNVERVGMWCMLAIVVLTLLGLFSNGVLSTTETRAANGQLSVHYERFLRNGASSLLVIEVHGQPGATLALRIDGALLDGLTVESITPPVEHAATSGNTGMQLQLVADSGGQARVHLAIRADGVGLFRSVINGAGASLPMNQFIFP